MQRYDYTDSLRRVLTAAAREAAALKHEHVSPEHFVLALASSEDRMLLQVWPRLGIDPAEIRRATLARFPAGYAEHGDGELSYTRSANRAIGFALSEASVLKDAEGLEPTHLLLGITHLGEEAATRILRDLGITSEQIRIVLADLRGHPLPKLAVVSIEIKIELRDGAAIQQTFAGGDAEALEFVRGYLFA